MKILNSNPPYTFAGVLQEEGSYKKAKAVIIPVPYDATTTYKGGTREGPHAIISASRSLGTYDDEVGEVHTLGLYTTEELLPFADPKQMSESVEEVVGDVLKDGKMPVILGGEHSITYGAVSAVQKKHPNISVLHIDAHADQLDEYDGTKYGHGSVMLRLAEKNVRIVSVGVRSIMAEEWKRFKNKNPKVILAKDYTEKSNKEILNSLTDEVYLSFDLDGLDPSIMPAVGTPEPDGLQWRETLKLLREVAAKKKIVGMDILELCPIPGNIASDVTAARLVYKMIGYALTKK